MLLEVNTKVFRGEACNLLSNGSTTIKIVKTVWGDLKRGREREGEGVNVAKY